MKRLLKRAAGTLGLRVFYTFSTFVTSVVLARLLGPTGFGTYTYSVSWAYLLAIPATLGFEGLMGREIAIYETRFAWNYISGIIRWANLLAMSVSVTLALSAGVIWYINQGDEPQLLIGFLLAMTALPFMSLRNIRRGAMQGLHRIVTGLMPEMLVAPIILLSLVGLSSFLLKDDFTVSWAIGAYSIATILTLILSAIFLDRALPRSVRLAFPYYRRVDWLKQAWPFMFLESIHVINARADILMLGALNGVEAAGIYVPVNRGAQLIVFILMAFNGPLGPTVASLYAEGKIKELQRIISRAARVCLLVSGTVAIILLIFGKQYLLVFGPEFVAGSNALLILCVGRVLYVFIGLASMVLSMTGHAQFTATSSLIGAVINILLNALLIPRYGVSGAAIATTTAVFIAGSINTFWVYRKVGITPNIFGSVLGPS